MSSSAPASAPAPVPLVMQLIVDGASSTSFGWPKGPWMAQSAHAAIAAIQTSFDSAATREYVSSANLESMHKVTLQTPAEGKAKMTLPQLSEKLTAARAEWEKTRNAASEDADEFPRHFLWIEQPENVPTCLAIAPNRKPAALKKVLRPCTLLKE